MGFDFIVIVPFLLSHCSCSFVFGCRVSFFVSSSIFLLMIVQQLVVILVLSQEGVSAHPSILWSSVARFFMLLYADSWNCSLELGPMFRLCRNWYDKYVEAVTISMNEKKYTWLRVKLAEVGTEDWLKGFSRNHYQIFLKAVTQESSTVSWSALLSHICLQWFFALGCSYF